MRLPWRLHLRVWSVAVFLPLAGWNAARGLLFYAAIMAVAGCVDLARLVVDANACTYRAGGR